LVLLCPISIFAAGHDLSTTTASQSQPVVTRRGDGFTAVWLEQSAPRIVGTRISQGGEPLDGLGIALAQKSTFSLAIAHSPSESLVVWSTNGNVYAVRLSPLGIPLDTRNVVSYFGGVNPLFHSSNALIGWQGAGGADGFVIERSLDGGMTWGRIDVVGPDVRTANEPASIGDLIRVVAFGPGGMSEGTVTSIGSQQRRHASH
jgi:hypothetical protein